MLILTFSFAFAFFQMFGQTLEQLVLAYSPGGLAEMSLVALAMNADIAYVASHHLLRDLICYDDGANIVQIRFKSG